MTRIPSIIGLSAALVSVGLAVAGCGGEPPSEPIASVQSDLMTTQFSWIQGVSKPTIDIGSAATQFCFLTSISGKFEGGGESIHLKVENGRWLLTGSSNQVGVEALARCQVVTNPVITDESTWMQPQGTREMFLGLTSDRACFLMGVQGRFRGAGEAVWVRRAGDSLWLGGQSQQAGVGGWARCLVNHTAFLNEWTWSQGFAPTPMVQALTENNGWACGLTRMTGNFRGGGEQIFIDWTGTTRRLLGNSQQSGVGASANCFF